LNLRANGLPGTG